MRILGVDPGTRVAGYGVVDLRAARPVEYVECGVIRAATSMDMPNRLHTITSGLEEVIEEFGPDVLVLEKAFHGRNVASALKLGQARGAILVLATACGLTIAEYAPASIKKSVAGNGRADKAEVNRAVRTFCGLDRVPAADAADALAVALTHGLSAGLVGAAVGGKRRTT